MRLVPDAGSRVAEEVVWHRLTIAAQPDDTTLHDHRAQREAHVDAMIDRVLDVLRLPENSRNDKHLALRAFVDGMTLAVCTGRLPLGEAPDTVHRYLTWLSTVDPQ